MAVSRHTFMDIFQEDFQSGENTIKISRIEIPKIQRDYAQGRTTEDACRVREHFLAALHKAFCDEPITLDFIYGDIDDGGVMTPLDGQQRLTTLFLLHWFAAKYCKVTKEQYAFLTQFSYETRYSARDFCKMLVSFTPSFENSISVQIEDQPWFPMDWKKDPTISSMLLMLDEIQKRFMGIPDLWKQLEKGVISFYFLPISDMGLTDALYIKMNSRGRPLTRFEHFKAELERELRLTDKEAARRIAEKTDKEWTDLLWPYHAADHTIGDEFLNYFRFVCDVICYLNDGTSQNRSRDEFYLIRMYFSHDSEQTKRNILLLENAFDCWCGVVQNRPDSVFEQFVSTQHEERKICSATQNYFRDCLKSKRMTFGNLVMLYAFLCYMQNREQVSEEQFVRRIRIVHNLVRNSSDELSDSTTRSGGNRMPSIIRQTAGIILDGDLHMCSGNGFNTYQLKEEAEKLQWTAQHPELEESLFTLEDHELLNGQIAVIGLNDPALFPRFASLFRCSWDAVDCALTTVDYYWQRDSSSIRRYRSGTGEQSYKEVWKNLFHGTAGSASQSHAVGTFENTKRVLTTLLSKSGTFSDDVLQQIIKTYLEECEKSRIYEWRYYYIKYKEFRPKRYGKFYVPDDSTNYYSAFVMQTEKMLSSNSYQPFLKVVDEQRLDRDDLGRRLVFGDLEMRCESNGFVIRKKDTSEIVRTVTISQNSDGIDTEDRIQKIKPLYREIFMEQSQQKP